MGEVTFHRDRYGVEHQYEYNALGQQTLAKITSAPSQVETAGPDRIKTEYDALGRAFRFTSLKGTVVKNQVLRKFDGFGAITDEYQNHSAVVNEETTPRMQYKYEASGHRLSDIVYPNGVHVVYEYSTLDDALGRPTNVVVDGDTVESYSYLGMDRVMKRVRPDDVPDLTVTLDALGRVNEHKWANSQDHWDKFTYSYDRNSNVTVRGDLSDDSANGHPQTYGYDNLNRLTAFTRGDSSLSQAQADYMGATWTYSSTDGSPQSTWTYKFADVSVASDGVYDLGNSNRALRLKDVPNNINNSLSPYEHTSKFDPWNRLVSDGMKEKRLGTGTEGVWVDLSTSTYSYDALGRMIKLSTEEIYHDIAGNIIQDDQGTYVHAPDGKVILREDEDEIIFVQHDAQGYTTSLVDEDGDVLRRFIYDAHGVVDQRDADWDRDRSNDSDYRFTLLKDGQRYDWNAKQYVSSVAYDPFAQKLVQPNLEAYWKGFSPYDHGMWEGWGYVAAGSAIALGIAVSYLTAGLATPLIASMGLTTAGGTTLSLGGTIAVEAASGFTGAAITSGAISYANGASIGGAVTDAFYGGLYQDPQGQWTNAFTGLTLVPTGAAAGQREYDPHPETYSDHWGWTAIGYGGAILMGGMGGAGMAGIRYMAASVLGGAISGGLIQAYREQDVMTGIGWGANVGSFAGAFPGAMRGAGRLLGSAVDEGVEFLTWAGRGVIRGIGGSQPPTALSVVGGRTIAAAWGGESAISAGAGVLGGANVNWGGLFGNAVFSISRNPHILDLLESGAINPTTDYFAGVISPDKHHVFPQEYRAMFAKRGINIDKYMIELDEAIHQAIHGGGDWKLARQIKWTKEWNRAILDALKLRTRVMGRRLTPAEIIETGRDVMKRYDIEKPFIR